MTGASRSKRTVHLTHGRHDRVKITDHKSHVFFMGLGAAIKACRRARENQVDFSHDALEILVLLEDFAARHGGSFGDVAFRAEGGRLHFYFSSRSEAFDPELSGKLAELETQARERLLALRIDTRQVPAAELEALRAMNTREKNGDRRRAHQHVEA